LTSSRDDDWIEWLTHNLALDVPEAELRAELIKNGYDAGSAAALMSRTRDNPAFRAASRLGRDLKKWASLSDVLTELESLSLDFSSVPRVSNLSQADFLRDYYATNRPVIIEDVVKDWPAVTKWNLAYFKERFGAEQVRYQSGRSSDDHRDSFVDHSVTGSLADYIDLIDHCETNHHYLIAHDRLLDRPAFQPLFDDIRFDARYFDGDNYAKRVFLWLGPKGSTTPLHRDLGNVFFAQIHGRKNVKLVPSKQMHLVYNETGYHSEADFENLSLENYPLLRRAFVMEEVIHPGELLFIPVGWWHFVKALDISVTVTGNNFPFRNVFTAIF
jgi:Cupin-like domain